MKEFGFMMTALAFSLTLVSWGVEPRWFAFVIGFVASGVIWFLYAIRTLDENEADDDELAELERKRAKLEKEKRIVELQKELEELRD